MMPICFQYFPLMHFFSILLNIKSVNLTHSNINLDKLRSFSVILLHFANRNCWKIVWTNKRRHSLSKSYTVSLKMSQHSTYSNAKMERNEIQRKSHFRVHLLRRLQSAKLIETCFSCIRALSPIACMFSSVFQFLNVFVLTRTTTREL